MSANQDVAQREAGKLQNSVQGDVDRAQSDISKASTGYTNALGGDEQSASKASSQQGPRGVRDASATQQAAPLAAQVAPSTPQERAPRPTAPALSGEQQAAKAPGYTAPAPDQGDAPAAPAPTASGGSGEQRAARLSPWASLGGHVSPGGVSGAALTQAPAANPLAQYGRAMGLAPGAAANAPNAPKDLEQQMGQSAWGSLLGEAGKAQGEANALGTEAGVQALLQQRGEATPTGPANSAFDAALINGQGAPGFEKLSQQYGNGQLEQQLVNADKASQDRWSQLQGDAATRQAFDAAGAGAAAGPVAAAPAATAASAATDSGWSEQDQNGWQAAQNLAAQQSQQHGGQAAWDFTGGAGDDSVDDNGVIHVPRKQQGGKFSADWGTWWGGGSDVDPRTLGLSATDLYALANVSPEQRAKWLKTHKGGSNG